MSVDSDSRPMALEELQAMPKIDAHAHLVGRDVGAEGPLVELLERRSTRWIDLCWLEEEEHLRGQIDLAKALCSRHPRRFSWATAFSLREFGTSGWTDRAIAEVERGHAQGAVAVKVWKNIGMTLKQGGRYVMIDDPRFHPVLERVRELGLTLAAHLGEPRNCWLPLVEMTVEGDRSYYRGHPQYHGLLLPELPGYWEQVEARDRMLGSHPGLRVVGCHLASVEYDVAEIARRLDRFPGLAVDLAGRVCHFQAQDRETVRSFVLAHQDRILYGTDLGAAVDSEELPAQVAQAERASLAAERYFATDEVVEAPQVAAGFMCRGLALPAGVLRKLFRENALRWYPRIADR